MTEVDMLQTMAQMDIPPEEFDLTQPGVAEMALLSTMAPKVRSNQRSQTAGQVAYRISTKARADQPVESPRDPGALECGR